MLAPEKNQELAGASQSVLKNAIKRQKTRNMEIKKGVEATKTQVHVGKPFVMTLGNDQIKLLDQTNGTVAS